MDFNDLKKFIKEKPEELEAILDTTRASILSTPELKILHAKHLTNFWKDRINKDLTYLFIINEKSINSLVLDAIAHNLPTVITEELKTNRILHLNEKFEIQNASPSEIKENFILSESEKGNIVFIFGKIGIDIAVRGRIFPKINVFYDEADRIKYAEKYHISELQECLKEYEVYIKEPGVNEAFFASKNLIAKIVPFNPPNNVLVNKPENRLRNNLMSFLNRNTQHSFSKENELNNKRELDLYTEVDGKKYLIEVKWLGQSVNDDETALSQKVTDLSARDGVIQTLEYIKHLYEEMNFNIHCGYLCVFDARDNKKPVNYQEFTFVAGNLLPYFKSHFKILDEISLDRIA
jgi:hypothetical protein